MNGLREKFRNKKGFTLVEMLIVVAIIAILIAVSIPMVGTALERSREAVDQANARSAVGLASAKLLGEYDTVKKDAGTNPTMSYKYHVDESTHQGTLVATTEEGVKPQCKCNNADSELTVTITLANGEVSTNWTFEGGKTKDSTGGTNP